MRNLVYRVRNALWHLSLSVDTIWLLKHDLDEFKATRPAQTSYREMTRC